MAVGCDLGTGFLVAARQGNNQQIQTRSIRDAFLDFDSADTPTLKSMLSMNNMNYIEDGDRLFLIGNDAVNMANIFKREARRPLSRGVISPGESDAEKILLVILDQLLGKATVPNEVCFYSVPGIPIDREGIDITYHTAIFGKLINSLGYKAMHMNESQAIVYSNCAKEQFSGLAISFGCGMTNIALLYQTMVGMAYSISYGGDYIDYCSGKNVNSTAARIQIIKERGLNLLDAKDGDPKFVREREALIIYYKSLILRVLESIKNEFVKKKNSGAIDLPNAIPLIISGGTSLPKGFKELFIDGFNLYKDKMSIPISETRLATDQLNATAQGLLVAALNYNDTEVKKQNA
jgi:hypothetical protein